METGSEGGNRPWQSYHTVYTNAKAGMEGVDKDRVQRIVYEMSKGSKYFESEKHKEEQMRQKIENLRAQCAKLAEKDIAHYQKIADKKILELESSRDLSKMWLHCDMDAFYAAVEMLENPLLEGKPVAVGSMSMICTANYEARKFGVRAAMPGFIACKLCPDLIFVPTNFKKYTLYSELTRKVFERYDPDFIPASLDEAYLNVTNACEERGLSGDEIASEIRSAIHKETALTCSVGVAPNRLLAKVCSDINKPNGQFILPNDRKAVATFITTLPIRKIGGIGKVTEHMLRDVLGVTTCEEMLEKSAYICALFSRCATDFFLSVGLGLGRTDTPEHKLRKSISTERTFSATEDEVLLSLKLVDIAETLSADMQKEGLSGRTLTLKLKTASFEVRTRAVTLENYIQSKEEILYHGSKLLKAELPLSLRLMGLRMSNFQNIKNDHLDPSQKTLTGFVINRNITRSDTCVSSLTCSNISDQNPMSNDQMPAGNENYSLNKDQFGCQSSDRLAMLDIPSSSINTIGERDLPSSSSDACREQDTQVCQVLNLYEMNGQTNNHPQKKGSHDNRQPLWVDDYICSLCGIELPQSFTEERQEHADYHFAKILQDEFSQGMKEPTSQERFVRKTLQAKGTPKKQKYLQKKRFVTIDSFFSKNV